MTCQKEYKELKKIQNIKWNMLNSLKQNTMNARAWDFERSSFLHFLLDIFLT